VLIQLGILNLVVPGPEVVSLLWTTRDWGWLAPGVTLTFWLNFVLILTVRVLVGQVVVGAVLIAIGVRLWFGSAGAAVAGFVLIGLDTLRFGPFAPTEPSIRAWALLGRISVLLLLGATIVTLQRPPSRPPLTARWLAGAGLAGHLLTTVVLVSLAASAVHAEVDRTEQYARDGFTCLVAGGGQVKCWGSNSFGRLGDGSRTNSSAPVVALTDATAVATATFHACALDRWGGVKCWGSNLDDQLGRTGDGALSPIPVSGLTEGVTSIATGFGHSCASRQDGTVLCWGDNLWGQLGDGSTDDHAAPTPVPGISATEVVAGSDFTCAVSREGAVACWGDNTYGQLGDDSTTGSAVPVAVAGLGSGSIAVTAGDGHACALTAAGGVLCWGDNQFGQLGDGTTTDRTSPVAVVGLAAGVVAVSAGDRHTCAVTADGGVRCWGANDTGQLGDGTDAGRATPVPVAGLTSPIETVVAGEGHSCAVTAGHRAWCWGVNGGGQLGDGTTTDSRVPVAVAGF
jgi:alpha-tubulin suppressor-like RCC1 family protein